MQCLLWVIWKIPNWRIENGLLWPAAVMTCARFKGCLLQSSLFSLYGVCLSQCWQSGWCSLWLGKYGCCCITSEASPCGEVTFFLLSSASGVWQFPEAQWNHTEIWQLYPVGSYTDTDLVHKTIWITFHTTCLATETQPDNLLSIWDFYSQTMPPFPFFIRALVTLTPCLIIWDCVKMCWNSWASHQNWHCQSSFVLNAGTQSFFGCDALENSFFIQDESDTDLTLQMTEHG